MADHQHALICKVVLDGTLDEAIAGRITTDFFDDDEYIRVWDYLVKHWTDHGEPPDEDVVNHAFPAFPLDEYDQPTRYYIQQLQTRRRKIIATEALSNAAELLQDAANDPDHVDKIIQEMEDAVARSAIETSGQRISDITTPESIREYEQILMERTENPGALRGITTGFDGIDYVTGGFQPEHFVVLFGLPKSFKSATMLAMANAVHMAGEVPMVVGFEMSHAEQMDRLMSLRSGVDLNKILQGRLSAKDEKAIGLAQDILKASRPFTFVTDITATSSVAGIAAQMREVNPSVVFVDGIYLMESTIKDADPGSEAALRDISRSFKRLAQSTKTPIVITSQASLHRSKGGLTLASGMYTQALGQDANIVLGTERVLGEGQTEANLDDHGPAEIKLKVLASRSGPRKVTHVHWDWSQGSAAEIDPEVMRQRLNAKNNPSPGTAGDATFVEDQW